jgi:hypothetical protein
MAERNPVVSITAVKEFLKGGGDVGALRSFLVETGGGVGNAPSREVLKELTAAGLKAADARVVRSAIEEGIRVLTRDKYMPCRQGVAFIEDNPRRSLRHRPRRRELPEATGRADVTVAHAATLARV